MKKNLSVFLLFLPFLSFSQSRSFEDRINDIVQPAVDAMGMLFFYKPFESIGFDMPLVVLWLVVGAVVFTLYMGFVNIRGLRHAYQLIRGDYDKPEDEGEVSHFQALVTALSGTVGLGNIAGVAVAITIGGAGATFWMIAAGFLGMSSKFVECTLGVKYRKMNDLGEVSGGPMYYLSEGLKRKGFSKLGKVLAVVFAVLCVGGSLGGGNMFQANQSFAQLANVFPTFKESGFIYGLVLAVLVAIVIIGGIKKIASVTDKIVPFMVSVYVITSILIITINITEIGEAFSEIFRGAFTADGIKGGVIGVLIVGFQRAAFSNEAGVGSAAIAHSAVKTDEPVSEGLVALFEPFIDTILVCTMTALVLIFTGFSNPKDQDYIDSLSKRYDISAAYIDSEFETIETFKTSIISESAPERVVLLNANKGVEIHDFNQNKNEYVLKDKLEGAKLTSEAFSVVFPWFRYILLFAIILFAFSTMISWSYYGMKAWTYLFGNTKTMENIYKFIFLIFVVVGSSSSLGAVIDFSDMMILGMAFPNILGLYFLSSEVRKDLKDYFRRLKSGEIKKYN
ncbi:MAG: alanine/glycine:cation symporter family protein [Flavobacterium sp.]